jgi:glucosamine--fructose-6-phosphate aminotransferase (isomerizing)
MIFEIPLSIKQTLRNTTEMMEPILGKLSDRENLYFTGCGTGFFAAMLGSQVLSLAKNPRIRCSCVPALELLKYDYFIDRSCAAVGISHSGITKTTLDALKHAKENGAFSLGITHFEDRPISNFVDRTLVVGNNPDKSRCHTKCYVAAAAACTQIGIELLKQSGMQPSKRLQQIEGQLNELPGTTARVLTSVDGFCKRLAEEHSSTSRYYFAGTGPNVPNTLEAALKIMETSFVSAQGFETEQLLHGPWVSLDNESLLFLLAPKCNCHQRNMDLVSAAKTLGAPVVGLIDEGDDELAALCDEAIQLPALDEYLSPFVNIIPLYLFAYYSSVKRGFNPDLLRYSTPAYWEARQVIFPPGTH